MDKEPCCAVTPWEEKALKTVPKHLDKLLSQGGPVHYHKGHIIFYEGHSPYGLYLLKKGEIQLSRTDIEGHKKILPETNETTFGLYHLITNTTHCATAQAKTDVEVIFVPKALVLELLSQK